MTSGCFNLCKVSSSLAQRLVAQRHRCRMESMRSATASLWRALYSLHLVGLHADTATDSHDRAEKMLTAPIPFHTRVQNASLQHSESARTL